MAERSNSAEDRLFLSVPSHPKYIGYVRALVDRAAEEAQFNEEERRELVLAVDEACSNVIKHAYKGDAHQKIDVTLQLPGQSITVEIRDYGPKVELSEIHPRALDDVKPGGLGTHFMQCCMDSVEFDTSPPQGNILRMVKKRSTRGKGT